MTRNPYNKHSLLILSTVCLTQLINAQLVTENTKRIADGFYNRSDYASAAKYYEQSLITKGKEVKYVPYQVRREKTGTAPVKTDLKHESMYRLAESYRLLNDFAHAEAWYKTVTEEVPGAYPLAQLYYGVSLRANGKYQEAEGAYKKFLEEYKTEDTYRQQALRELDNCLFIQEQLQTPNASLNVTKFNNIINKEGANYAAVWQQNNLVFTSTRADENIKTKKPVYTNALYTTTLEDSVTGNVFRLNVPGKKELQQGVGSFTPDGNTLFFTGWFTDKEGKKNSAIYKSVKNDTSWTEPVKMDATINQEASNTRQPQVTADGKYLFFASDRAGGSGGFDIWYAALGDSLQTGEAVNAGSVINTKEDDEAPFYHPASGTLVYASKGRTGMGGFDLYYSKGDLQSWATPVNAGHPVNSVKDDMYFTSRGSDLWADALVSSDRASLCCLELFSVSEVKAPPVVAVTPPAPVVVKDEIKEAFENKTTLVTTYIIFDYDKASISDTSHAYLDTVASYMKQYPDVKIEVGAHTDGKGSVSYNLKLSDQRAKACVDYFVKAGIDPSRFISKGYGECCPIIKETTDNGKDNPEARSQNRRVEIKLY